MTKRDPNLTAKGQRRCLGMNKVGRPCESFALRDDDRCFAHSTRNQDVLERARSTGGRVSRRGQSRRTLQALVARLYADPGAPDYGFKLVPEEDIVRPRGTLFIESVDGRYKAVGTFDCDDDPHAEFVERSPLDGYVHWLSDHPYALRQRALSLVGLRENTIHDGNRRYRYTTRDLRPVDEGKVEAFLQLVVPEEPTR